VVRLDDRVLGVSCRVPPLGHGRLERLPAAVRRRHEEILAAVAVLNVSPPTDGNEDRDPSFPDGSRVHREPIIKRWCSSRSAASRRCLGAASGPDGEPKRLWPRVASHANAPCPGFGLAPPGI
jgi:hypothetical protein